MDHRPAFASGTAMLSEFPFLTATEFLSACRAFVDRVHACGSLEHLGWSSVRLQQQPNRSILKVTKSIGQSGTPGNDNAPPDRGEDGESQMDKLEEDDNVRNISPERKCVL